VNVALLLMTTAWSAGADPVMVRPVLLSNAAAPIIVPAGGAAPAGSAAPSLAAPPASAAAAPPASAAAPPPAAPAPLLGSPPPMASYAAPGHGCSDGCSGGCGTVSGGCGEECGHRMGFFSRLRARLGRHGDCCAPTCGGHQVSCGGCGSACDGGHGRTGWLMGLFRHRRAAHCDGGCDSCGCNSGTVISTSPAISVPLPAMSAPGYPGHAAIPSSAPLPTATTPVWTRPATPLPAATNREVLPKMPREQNSVPASTEKPKPTTSAPAPGPDVKVPPTNVRTIETEGKNPF
jgi:hypothetical protein